MPLHQLGKGSRQDIKVVEVAGRRVSFYQHGRGSRRVSISGARKQERDIQVAEGAGQRLYINAVESRQDIEVAEGAGQCLYINTVKRTGRRVSLSISRESRQDIEVIEADGSGEFLYISSVEGAGEIPKC